MTNKIQIVCPDSLRYLQPQILRNLLRVGNYSDGGYAISGEALDSSTHFLSLGLGENWSFEEEVANRNSDSVIDIYDHTVSLKFFLIKALKGTVKFLLLKESKLNLMSRFSRLTKYRDFWVKTETKNHHRTQVTSESFQEILISYPEGARIGLKVDIEGSEWEILNLISINKFRFVFILIEIHDFDNHEKDLKTFINELRHEFVLSHLHANNFEPLGRNGFPRVFELTLIKQACADSSGEYRKELPVSGLDVPNAKNRPDFRISFS